MTNSLLETKVLRIDLASRKVSIEPVPPDYIGLYLGGRGLGTKMFFDEVDPKVDPLGPENKLLFVGGLLTGTFAPTAGRYMVVTKSPLTGTIASSNAGGFWGAELRKAGIWVIILEGRSETPLYLFINDGEVMFLDAAHLWGLDTHQTTEKIVDELGDAKIKIACIGPAGENLVKFAAIMNDKHRAAGRSGVGAVMGSKNLKAIAVKGTQNVDLLDKETFLVTMKRHSKTIREDRICGEGLPALGTKVLDSIINENGLYPAYNFQKTTYEDIEKVNGEALAASTFFKKKKACFACPIACGRDVELPDGHKGEGPEYESGWAFGAACGISDLFSITKANFLCNELGMDTISAGVTIATVMELLQKGYIPEADFAGGPKLEFGNHESMLFHLKKIATRQGFGDRLAEGSFRLATHYGHPELSMSVKKQEIPAYDPRGVQGLGLQYATSNRGGCHVRGYMISPEILGSPEKLDPQQLEGKPEWVKGFQDTTAIIDSLGMCLFTSFALGIEAYTELVNAGAGLHMTPQELAMAGDRIWNLERLFNLAAGILPDQDTLPDRFLYEEIPDGPQKGIKSKLVELLTKYYATRGWDDQGYPTVKKLAELGLDDLRKR